MTPEQWKNLKNSEQQKNQSKKNLGTYGITRGFRSRSLQSFQTDLEQGKAKHLLPMYNAKEKLKSGVIKTKDIPYMQRKGGSWDGADVCGKKKKGSTTDTMDNNYKRNSAPSPSLSLTPWPKNNSLGTAGKRRRGKDTGAAQPSPKRAQTKKFFGIF
mmetsp:Transcript_20933/g.44163  ORF Transcript_20933/g.44163 Transcript_20933/m.44163 type:complete len:157 (-) Transcript_20933:47-517(-)